MNIKQTPYPQLLKDKSLLPVIFCLIFFGFIQVPIFAQKTFQATEVQASGGLDNDIAEKIGDKAYRVFSLDLKELNKFLVANQGQPPIEFSLQLDEKAIWHFALEPNDLRRLPGRKNFECRTYKGNVNALAENTVRLLISESYFGGYVTVGKTRYSVLALNDVLNNRDKSGQFILQEFPYQKPPNVTKSETTAKKLLSKLECMELMPCICTKIVMQPL